MNNRYPNTKELNNIRIYPSSIINYINLHLIEKWYTFNIPVVGLDISSYNIVLSNQFLELNPNQVVSLTINCQQLYLKYYQWFDNKWFLELVNYIHILLFYIK